jgi:hypothetical protein
MSIIYGKNFINFMNFKDFRLSHPISALEGEEIMPPEP